MKENNQKISIIGAGGHARSVIALLRQAGYDIEGIYDNYYKETPKELILGVPVVGLISAVPNNVKVVLAVGSNTNRNILYHQFKTQLILENAIHPTAFIESSVNFGDANLIFAKTFINAAAQIGSNTIINSGAIVEHESVIGSHTHISVNTTIAGRCTIGKRCFIGAGATVIDKVKICDDVIIGAGAVVIQDITEPGTYVGNPVRKL